jgi:hypothetical protein
MGFHSGLKRLITKETNQKIFVKSVQQKRLVRLEYFNFSVFVLAHVENRFITDIRRFIQFTSMSFSAKSK